jgi:hypothetical protein
MQVQQQRAYTGLAYDLISFAYETLGVPKQQHLERVEAATNNALQQANLSGPLDYEGLQLFAERSRVRITTTNNVHGLVRDYGTHADIFLGRLPQPARKLVLSHELGHIIINRYAPEYDYSPVTLDTVINDAQTSPTAKLKAIRCYARQEKLATYAGRMLVHATFKEVARSCWQNLQHMARTLQIEIANYRSE